MIRWLHSVVKKPVQLTQGVVRGLWKLQHRERMRLWAEISEMRGLMPLLMKQRNGYRWSESDRHELRMQLRRLASLSPYMALFIAPGGLVVLPLLAWWLDRRRQKRLAPERPSEVNH